MKYRIVVPDDQRPLQEDSLNEAWIGPCTSKVVTPIQLAEFLSEFLNKNEEQTNRFYVERMN